MKVQTFSSRRFIFCCNTNLGYRNTVIYLLVSVSELLGCESELVGSELDFLGFEVKLVVSKGLPTSLFTVRHRDCLKTYRYQIINFT